MSLQSISTPQVQINDVVYKVVGNTVSFDPGKPEINVRVASTGGGAVETVHSTNIETAFSTAKFEIYTTADGISDHLEWKDNIGGNTIKFTQKLASGDSVNLVFNGQSLINKVEWNATSDGTASLEWAGDPMVEI